jgi:hypothetical protein
MGKITAGREKSNDREKRCRTFTRTVLTRKAGRIQGSRNDVKGAG